MILNLHKHWRLVAADRLNIALEQEVKNTAKKSESYGQYAWVNRGYYGNLKQALGGYVRHSGNCLEGEGEKVYEELARISKVIDGIYAKHGEAFRKMWNQGGI